MRTHLRLILLLTLSTSLYAAPSLAQRQPHPDGGDRGERNREIVERVLRQDRERSIQARRWAEEHRTPVRLRQPGGRIVQIVGVHGVRPVYVTTHNTTAATLTGTRHLHPGQRAGLDLTGRGLRIGLWDGGHALLRHQEFGTRVSTTETLVPDEHATHVAGTLAGAGVDAGARGMAFEAAVTTYDWDRDVQEMHEEARDGLLLSNHSYGEIAGWFYGDLEDGGDTWYWLGDPSVSTTEDYIFGHYGEYAALYDGVATANPYFLPVVSAGNDRGENGPSTAPYRALGANGAWKTITSGARPPADGGGDGFDTVSGASNAKNVLTIGAFGTDALGMPRPSSFSSFGPTDDGRIKPDLVGYGERVYSAVSSGPDDYGRMSGTSMATPNVAGSLLLLQQHHHDLRGYYLTAAALKGLALHTARDLGSPGPDYRTGWGMLDAEAAALLLAESVGNPALVLEDTLYDGDTYSRLVQVTGAGPVRITLSWTDPVAAEQPARLDDRTPRLLNDLDVRLVDQQTGASYLPYRLDPAAPSQPAVPGDNTLDPVEQVYVEAPRAGTYALVVTHKAQLSRGIAQPFAVLAAGVADADLPVLVGSMDVQANVDRVGLRWETTIERAPGTFRVERTPVIVTGQRRVHAGDPVEIAAVPSGGDGSGRTYRYEDQDVLAGDYLYRVYYDAPEYSYMVAEALAQVDAPERLTVLHSYPNPFSGRATLVVDLPAERTVRLEVYDALGRRVALVMEERLAAGRHEIPVEASGWAPGLYLARLTAGSRILTHQMVLVR